MRIRRAGRHWERPIGTLAGSLSVDRDFWLDKWARNEIGFHQPHPHAALERHWASLGLAPGARVFVPLAGKSLDVLWLREHAHRVVTVEIAARAIQEFLAETGLTAQSEHAGRFTRLRAEGLDLLCGDVFDLDRATLGPIAAVFDRAALVALPAPMRAAYAARMAEITAPGTRTLLITVEYEQTQMSGPPFSVSETEVRALYGGSHQLRLLGRGAPPDAVRFAERGVSRFTEAVYALERQ